MVLLWVRPVLFMQWAELKGCRLRFGKLHPRYKTPVGAIVLVGGICTITPLLGKNALVWFVNASAFGSVIAYLMVAISFAVKKNKSLI